MKVNTTSPAPFFLQRNRRIVAITHIAFILPAYAKFVHAVFFHKQRPKTCAKLIGRQDSIYVLRRVWPTFRTCFSDRFGYVPARRSVRFRMADWHLIDAPDNSGQF